MAPKNPSQGKHREFGNFAKTQGIWFAQVVNSLILKVKDICRENFQISFKMDKSAKSVLCIQLLVTNHVNWHRENLRSNRE